MSDEQFPPGVSEENNENSSNVTLDRPMSTPSDEIVEALEMVVDPPSLPDPEATTSAPRRSARISNRDKTHKELGKTISGKVHKSTKARSGQRLKTCHKCGNSHICFPARTKYYTCAEVDGQLVKVKQISGKVARAPPKK